MESWKNGKMKKMDGFYKYSTIPINYITFNRK